MKMLSEKDFRDCMKDAVSYDEIRRSIAIEKIWIHEVSKAINLAYENNKDQFDYCMKFGDGNGGSIVEYFKKAIGVAEECVTTSPSRKSISNSIRKAVFERDEYRCKHCGTHIDLTIDHITPVSSGGTDERDNLQTLCRPCNSRKGVNHD